MAQFQENELAQSLKMNPVACALHVSCSERMGRQHRKMRAWKGGREIRESEKRNLGKETREEQQEGKVEGPGVT